MRSNLNRTRVGIFSTVPIEVLLAADAVPVDVNNLFITHEAPGRLLDNADEAGMPRNICAWTRGLYAATVAGNLQRLVVVPAGDCTNNVTMSELLARIGVDVVPFSYPLAARDSEAAMNLALEELAGAFSTTLQAAEVQWEAMQPLRRLLASVDAAMAEGWMDAAQARLLLLESTDCGGNVDLYARRVSRMLEQAVARPRDRAGLRLAVFGIPTILSDLGERLAEMGAQVVLWETERDFAMVRPAASLAQQYLNYAYPYGLEARLEAFLPLLEERRVDGVLVNTQAFCHHNLELRKLEESLGDRPHLVLESDTPGAVSARDRIRLEGFCSLLRRKSYRSTSGPKPSPAVEQTKLAEGPMALGLDLGSRFAKVTLAGNGLFRQRAADTIDFYRRFANRSQGTLQLDLVALLAELDCPVDPAELQVVATGYGRHVAALSNAHTIPELEAHARGAAYQVAESHFILVDWGGQDTKVMEVKSGAVADFVMNDKCAAGSGRYVENMARLLGEPLDKVLSGTAEPVELTNICATFGESEVIGHLVSGVPVDRISAGVLAGVAQRTAQLIARSIKTPGLPLFLAGGLAAGGGLKTFLAQATGLDAAPLPETRFNGAIGCVLVARDLDVAG